MKKLLHIEQIKILNYNPFRITLALYFIFFTLGIVIYPLMDREIPVVSISDIFRFPDVWYFFTWITEPYNALLAIIIIMITSKEFANHTFKTQVIFGMSRTELLLQRLLSIVILSLFATLLVGVSSMIMGLIYSYKITFKIAMENTWILSKYFLAAFSYMTFGLLFALMIKNTAMAILSFLALRMFVEPVIFLILKDYEVKWYLPFRTISRLTPVPDLIQIFERRMNTGEPVDVNGSSFELLPQGLPLWLNILMVVLYVTLMIFFCYRLIQRRRLT
ncbi:MAG TPA: hypothetical protein ENN61_03910 [Bacteroidaceae bacterium]|nr:hypothetical protein [Bacteroidaceae bacterium]